MQEKLQKDFGFSKKESAVYLALLKLGNVKAVNIARETELNRTTVYDLLENLLKKGLVSKYKKSGSTFFSALDPERLINYLEHDAAEKMAELEKRKQQIKAVLPQLISLKNKLTTKPKVQFFEGEKGMREAYEDTLTSKETILAFANVQTMHQSMPNFFPQYYNRRAGKKIAIKAILPKNQESYDRAKLDQKELRESRFLPTEEMIFSPEINLYHNKMLISSWKEKMAIIIESKELVDLQKLIHGLVWESLEKHNIK